MKVGDTICQKYILKRIVGTIPTLIIVITFVFFFVRLIPGDPARLVAGEQATQDDVEAVREELGLNKSIPTQYVTYVTGLLKGNLGTSLRTKQPVTKEVAGRFGNTVRLAFVTLLWSSVVGVLFGVWSGTHRGKMAGLHRNDDCGLGYFAPLVLDRLSADYAVCGKTPNSADNKRNEPEKSDYAIHHTRRRNCSRDCTIYKILHY